jgi:hypothetical protein
MGGFNFNPVLSEIQSHLQSMSPDAQAAVKMANPSLPSPAATAATQAPSVLPPGMLLPRPADSPEPAPISMGSSTPSLSMPSEQPSVKAPMGTIQGDTNERGRLLSTGAGVDQIANRIEKTGFGQNHPLLGKLLGGVAQTTGKIGDVGLSLVAPEVAALIPGTSIHHQMLLGQANQAVTQDTTNAQKEAQAASENATAGKTNAETPEVAPEAEARIGAENATAGHENAQTAVIPEEEADKHALNQPTIERLNAETDALGHPSTEHLPVLNDSGQSVMANYNPKTQQYTDAAGKVIKNPRPIPPSALISEGDKNLWSVPQADGTNKVVQLRTGDTIPKGAVSLSGQNSENLKTGTADAPTISALKFANDYLQTGAFTGPSDEALQDQFFQMAKPSTGFRMNQAQVSQLHDMASWMDSWKGKAYHAMNGVWFAPDQRQNIVNTMNQLAASKGIDVKALTGDTGPNPVNPQNRQGQPNAQQPAGGKQNDPLGIR